MCTCDSACVRAIAEVPTRLLLGSLSASGLHWHSFQDLDSAKCNMSSITVVYTRLCPYILLAARIALVTQQEGLKVGQQILAVSDPVNEGQMLSLESQPSKMALIRAMNMRRYPEIEMVFSSDLSPVASKIIDGAGRKSCIHACLTPALHNCAPHPALRGS